MKFKKLLCCVLALAMVLGTMGITTFAEGEVETISVFTAENLATALTKNEANIAVILEDNIDLPITSLGSITAGSGEYKLGGENTQEITIDLNQKTLNVTTTYWSALGSVNPNATITVKNGTMVSTGNSATTWNANDLRFCNCNWVFEDVTFNKEVALDNAGKSTTMNDVTINGTGDYYALWITAEGQTVNIDGLVIDTAGRGIKIDEQYVDAENTVQVALAVSNSTFKTAEKAAIVVKSVAGADISTENVDISNVVADSTNLVWVDEDSNEYYNKVQVSGGTVAAEGVDTEPIKVASKDELNQAISDAKNGQTIKLTANIEADQIKIEKAVTLDLGGYTLTTTSGWGGLLLKGGASLVNGNLSHTGNTAAIKLWDAREISDVTITVAFTEGKTKGGIVIQSDSVGVDVIKNVTISGDGLTNGIETYNCGKAAEFVIGSMNNVTIDAVGTAMNISAPCGTATDCTFSGDVTGIELWIKGTYSATLELVDCDVAGGSKAVYVHDEFNSNPDIENIGTLSLTVDEETTFESENGSVFTMTIARAENVNIDEQLLAYAVAENGKSKYSSFADAVAAAQDGDTITILGKVAVKPGDLPSSQSSIGAKTLTFKGADENSKMTFVDGVNGDGSDNAYYAHGSNLTFDGLKITWIDVTNYQGIMHPASVEYKNCTISGMLTLYGNKNTFTDCHFVQNADNKYGYNIWTWGSMETEFKNCKFTCRGKSINVYGGGDYASKDDYLAATNQKKLTIDNCEFYVENKVDGCDASAIAIKTKECPYDITIKDSTAVGFVESKTTGSQLYDVKDMHTDVAAADEKTTVTVNENSVDLTAVKEALANGSTNPSDAKPVIKIALVKNDAASTEDSHVYDIKVVSDSDINKLNSTDLTFSFATDKANEYAITAAENVVLTNDGNSHRYMFSYKNGTVRETAKEITIGQATVTGYGKYTLKVDDSASTNVVNATTLAASLVDSYVTDGSADGKLDIADSTTDENGQQQEIKIPTRKLSVKIYMNNKVADQLKAYQAMKVDIAGGEYSETIALGSDAVAQAAKVYTVEKDLPINTAYTVTVSGAGYRTARYTVNLTSDKTLNFWNNVADNAIEVELGNDAYKKDVTFLAGDIVKDGTINIYDLSAVVSYFGTINNVDAESEYAKYDLNRDGKIDSKDVAYVLVSWGN